MQQNGTLPFIISAQYSFADNGGAIAIIPLSVFTPPNAIITYTSTFIESALTSGGAATINVGIVGDENAFVAAATVASFSIGAVVRGIDLNAAPLRVTVSAEIAIEFVAFTILTGLCTTTVQGYTTAN